VGRWTAPDLPPRSRRRRRYAHLDRTERGSRRARHARQPDGRAVGRDLLVRGRPSSQHVRLLHAGGEVSDSAQRHQLQRARRRLLRPTAASCF
jgi:hypothetical protein